jgi:hypothetical protein
MQRAEWQLFAILAFLFVVMLLTAVVISSSTQQVYADYRDGWETSYTEEACDDESNVWCTEDFTMLTTMPGEEKPDSKVA